MRTKLSLKGGQGISQALLPFLNDFCTMMRHLSKTTKITVLCAVIYLFAFGLAQALLPIRPFWNDEWRLIYNIKFKTIPELWGRLDLLQECPRVYLSLLKYISASFDYSYTSLRLPPLIITLANLFFVFYLRKKLYPENSVLSYLFILILVSSQTFTDYMVQVKHYEMDIFLTLLVGWQLYMLLRLTAGSEVKKASYALLLLTFITLPYLGYIYPIAVAPVFPVVCLAWWAQRKKENGSRRTVIVALPLLLAVLTIILFYQIDIRQVMQNKDMYDSYQMAYYHSHQETLAEDFWKLFALVGSGFVFEIVFGILGIAAFFYGMYRLYKTRLAAYGLLQYFHLYAVLLLWGVLLLFATGKLVGGVARLTVYTVPAIAMLIIALLSDLKNKWGRWQQGLAIGGVLYLALLGNILTTCINTFTYKDYHRQITTYRNTGKALKEARLSRLPFMVTDGVNGKEYKEDSTAPGQIQTHTITPDQIKGQDKLAVEVIVKDHPEYKVWDTITYYHMPDAKWIQTYVQQLPPRYKAAVAGDGIHYQQYNKQ